MNNIQNPFVKGSSDFATFNSDVAMFSQQNTQSLQTTLAEYQEKANNFLNYNTFQMDMFDKKVRAIQVVLDSRQ